MHIFLSYTYFVISMSLQGTGLMLKKHLRHQVTPGARVTESDDILNLLNSRWQHCVVCLTSWLESLVVLFTVTSLCKS